MLQGLPRVAAGAAALLLLSCSGPAEEATAPPATGAGTTDAAPSGMAYPALYQDMGLPELPGGEVTSTGRQATSLRDGLSITVVTSMPVDAAREFYSTELAAQGWEAAPSRALPGLPLAGIQATREGLRYSATITATPDGPTRVDITVLEP